jgi:hypothetical protein
MQGKTRYTPPSEGWHFAQQNDGVVKTSKYDSEKTVPTVTRMPRIQGFPPIFPDSNVILSNLCINRSPLVIVARQSAPYTLNGHNMDVFERPKVCPLTLWERARVRAGITFHSVPPSP